MLRFHAQACTLFGAVRRWDSANALPSVALACLFALRTLLGTAAPLYADDGSWSAAWDVQNGPIYSATENPDVSLDRELLDFSSANGGNITAIFQFRNQSTKAVTVDAGFPIVVRLQVQQPTTPIAAAGAQTWFFVPATRYGGDSAMAAWAYAGVALSAGLRTLGSDAGVDPSALADDGLTDQYFALADVITRSTMTPRDAPFDIQITQDGKPVGIDLVVVEASVPGGASGGELVVTYHFKHSLHFAAGAQSTVIVTYHGFELSGEDNDGYNMRPDYSTDYVLATGATWKGPIGLLVVTSSAEINLELPAALKPIGTHRGKSVAVATGYEPAADDHIAASYSLAPKVAMMNGEEDIPAPTSPADSQVTNIRASSFLDDPAPSFVPQGIVRDATFKPLSLFDGMDETSWVEGVPGDGIGEWVEFQTTAAASGIEITNGYIRATGPVDGHDYETAFERNNRVKVLEITTPAGAPVAKIPLDDTPDRQRTYLDLPPGTYRAVIRAVYPGSRYHDTCLAEIRFLWTSTAVQQLLQDEPFIRTNWRDE